MIILLFLQEVHNMNSLEQKESNLEEYYQQPQEDYIDLSQYWSILKRRWLPASLVLVASILARGLVTLLQKPIYQAEGKVLFRKMEMDANGKVKEMGKELGTLNSLAIQAIEEFELKNEQGKPLRVSEFQSNLKVQPLKETNVLEISYQSTEPEKAKAVVGRLMDLYIQQNMSTDRAETVAARQFIENQLPNNKQKLEQAELALLKFKEQNQVLNLEEESRATVTTLVNLDNQISKAEVALADANKRSQAIRQEVGMSAEQAKVINTLSQSAGLQKALTDLQTVEGKLAAERSRFQDNAPIVDDLKNEKVYLQSVLKNRVKQALKGKQQSLDANLQIGLLQQKLTENFVATEIERLVLTNQIAALSKVYDNYQQRSKIIPQLQKQQRQLERDVVVAQDNYQNLLKKLEEVRINENQRIGNVQVLDAAQVLDKPVSPRKTFNLTVGATIGGIIAVLTTMILDSRDKSLKTIREARELLGYNVLGVIPSFDSFPKLEPIDTVDELPDLALLKIPFKCKPGSTLDEIYGKLYTNLKFFSADRARIITITSTVPKEGKSTISINLALMLSQLGFTALLVDTDMRNPTQHQLWGVENELGLSDAIAGTQEAEAIITNVKKNLYLLPAGNAKENPLALVNSKRMNDLVKELARSYDFVLFDTPPLNEAADARIIGSITDGILMVVQPQLVDVDRATATKELLQQYGHKVLGMIVNGVTNQKGFGRESLIESFMNMKRAMENNDSVGIVGDDRDFN
jgi:capsular exopolysaccharide synthesis family protein